MAIYDGQFRGNVLVARKIASSKTYFLKELGLNNLFGKSIKTGWVSGIEISKEREAEIQACFSNRS